MATYLLDTNAIQSISRKTLQDAKAAGHHLLLSPISLWELASGARHIDLTWQPNSSGIWPRLAAGLARDNLSKHWSQCCRGNTRTGARQFDHGVKPTSGLGGGLKCQIPSFSCVSRPRMSDSLTPVWYALPKERAAVSGRDRCAHRFATSDATGHGAVLYRGFICFASCDSRMNNAFARTMATASRCHA
jgi:hypothetical protein